MTAPPRPSVHAADSRTSQTRHTIGVIGAGRAGAVLGAALWRAGHRVVAASGASLASRARIANLLPGAEIRAPAAVPDGVDLVLLAAPDDVLGALAAELASTGALRPGQPVGHLSGAHGLTVLAPITAAGAQPFAMHPAMTFTGTAADLSRLAGISYGVTAPPALGGMLAQLIADLGGTVEWVAEEHRALYHAALTHGANHLITLVNEALDRLRDAGVRVPAAVLRPLLTASLDNTLRLGDAALTGPVSRGDAGTVAAHVAALRAAAPESVPPYAVLARRTADRAIAAGRLTAADAAPLLRMLADACDATPVAT